MGLQTWGKKIGPQICVFVLEVYWSLFENRRVTQRWKFVQSAIKNLISDQ